MVTQAKVTSLDQLEGEDLNDALVDRMKNPDPENVTSIVRLPKPIVDILRLYRKRKLAEDGKSKKWETYSEIASAMIKAAHAFNQAKLNKARPDQEGRKLSN